MFHYKTLSVYKRDFQFLQIQSDIRKFIVKRVHDKTIHYAYQPLKFKK